MELLANGNILLNQTVKTRQEVFELIASLAVKNGYARNRKSVVMALERREKEGTTGMMDGFAIPHGKDETIIAPGIFILTLDHGVEWHSLDGQPIRYIISLLIPDGEANETHLKMLSQVARMLMKEEVKETFKTAQNQETILHVFQNQLEK